MRNQRRANENWIWRLQKGRSVVGSVLVFQLRVSIVYYRKNIGFVRIRGWPAHGILTASTEYRVPTKQFAQKLFST